jgi:uncharacterized MnhB-related membrane protein
MSKQTINTIRTHLRWYAFSFGLLFLVIAMPLALAQRNVNKKNLAAKKSLLPLLSSPGSARPVSFPNAPKLGGPLAVECAGSYRVLVVSVDCDNADNNLRAILRAEPGISAADFFDAYGGTPTLAELQQYDIALVFCNCIPQDQTTLGNNLDAYISGGGIVVALNTNWVEPYTIGGTWLTNDSPFNDGAMPTGMGATLQTCTFAPLCDGVTMLQTGHHLNATLASGATQAGTWNDATIMMAYKGRSVGITGYFGDAVDGYSGQIARIVANAGRWLSPPSCAPVVLSAVSQKTHGGAGNFDVNLFTTTQCDTGLIQNDGFETGSFSPDWIIDGTNNSPLVTNTNSHSGTYSALAGGDGTAAGACGNGTEPGGDSSFYQQFTVPAGGGTLSFWHWDCSTDSILFDWQDAYITDSNGNILQTIIHQCDNAHAWVKETVNMTPYAGQTVRIKFLVHQDGAGDLTGMYVDDVVLTHNCSPEIEDRTNSATNDYTMVANFDQTVTVNGSPQAQVISGTGCVGTGGVCNGGMVTVSGPTVTIPLTNVGNAQTIQVRLNSVNNQINVTTAMSILIGDSSDNGVVNAADVAQTKAHVGAVVGGSNFREDVNANGVINAADVAIVKAHVGTSLPPQ